MEKKILGKGLSALIPERKDRAKEERIAYLKLDQIAPSPFQPRTEFSEEKLAELISSIKEKGIIQPIVVRPKDGGYELIAGERRVRALRALGLEEVPAIIKKVNDTDALLLSLIENLQRETLNPIEEARAYERLLSEFKLTQEEVAARVGKDRSSVANFLRLLNLPPEVQTHLARGELSMGHGRAILSVSGAQQQLRLAEKIIRRGLSVREAESLAGKKTREFPQPVTKDPELVALEEELRHIFGTKVVIAPSRGKGKIQIEYYSLEDLGRIVDILRQP